MLGERMQLLSGLGCGVSLVLVLGCGGDVPTAAGTPGPAAPIMTTTTPPASVPSVAPAAATSAAPSAGASASTPRMSSTTPAAGAAGAPASSGSAAPASSAGVGGAPVASAGTSGTSGAAGAAAESGTAGARAPTPSSPAAGSGGGAAGAATGGSGGSAAPREDLGEGDGKDVVMIGDSWMSNTLQAEGTGGGISPSLQRLSGKGYRNYAVQGVMLLSVSAFGPAIPSQWDTAKSRDPDIKTVIMTGAGNDVIQNPGLQADCKMNGEQCKEFRLKVFTALDKLWSQMADAGVKDIIYVAYAASAGNDMPDPDKSQNMPIPACTTGKVRCHALQTTDLVMDDLALDGIHPVRAANDRVAKALLEMMKTEGMRR